MVGVNITWLDQKVCPNKSTCTENWWKFICQSQASNDIPLFHVIEPNASIFQLEFQCSQAMSLCLLQRNPTSHHVFLFSYRWDNSNLKQQISCIFMYLLSVNSKSGKQVRDSIDGNQLLVIFHRISTSVERSAEPHPCGTSRLLWTLVSTITSSAMCRGVKIFGCGFQPHFQLDFYWYIHSHPFSTQGTGVDRDWRSADPRWDAPLWMPLTWPPVVQWERNTRNPNSPGWSKTALLARNPWRKRCVNWSKLLWLVDDPSGAWSLAASMAPGEGTHRFDMVLVESCDIWSKVVVSTK